MNNNLICKLLFNQNETALILNNQSMLIFTAFDGLKTQGCYFDCLFSIKIFEIKKKVSFLLIKFKIKLKRNDYGYLK